MGTPRRTAVIAVLAGTLLAGAAGCADGSPTASSGGGATSTTTSPSGPVPPTVPGTGPTGVGTPPVTGGTTAPPPTAGPPPTGPVVPPGTPRPPMKVTSVVGDVIEGVEKGCYLLRVSGGKDLLLIGASLQQIRAGGRIRVTGRVEPGLVTTCQQGVPFIVSDVSPA